MDDERLYKTLDHIYDKVNRMCCDIAALNAKADELKSDVHNLSMIPPRIECIDTRLETAEKAIESGRSKTWAIILIFISSLLVATGSFIVTMVTR